MTRHLQTPEILELHRRSIEQFGGSYGIRDEGMLDSAVAQPQATFGGKDLNPTFASKAAALGFSLIMNHPFVDGNKRTGFAAMAVFLSLNGLTLLCSADEGEATVLKVASSQMSRQELCDWIEMHILPQTDRGTEST